MNATATRPARNLTSPAAILDAAGLDGAAVVAALEAAGYVVRKKPSTRAAAVVEPFAPNTGDATVDAFLRRKHDPKYRPLPLPKAPGARPLPKWTVSDMDHAERAWNAACAEAAEAVAVGRPSDAEVHLRDLIALHRPAE